MRHLGICGRSLFLLGGLIISERTDAETNSTRLRCQARVSLPCRFVLATGQMYSRTPGARMCISDAHWNTLIDHQANITTSATAWRCPTNLFSVLRAERHGIHPSRRRHVVDERIVD